jgi:hypothetical protein
MVEQSYKVYSFRNVDLGKRHYDPSKRRLTIYQSVGSNITENLSCLVMSLWIPLRQIY